MKKYFTLLILFGLAEFAFATNEISPEGKIELPDVNFLIQDESQVPLLNQSSNYLKQTMPDSGKIDIEELAKSKVNERIKLDFLNDKGKRSFSLSTFKLYYGYFENLMIDLNFGKSIGSMNYQIGYLRNQRENIGFNGTNYFNTDLDLDDLNMNFIIGLGNRSDLNANFGYYQKSIGLYLNPIYGSENKLHVPLNIRFLSHKGLNVKFSAGLGGDYLKLTRKYATYESNRELWNGRIYFNYDSNWSQDNLLKMNANFLYRTILNNNVWKSERYQGGALILARFPLLRTLALEGGAGINLYNARPLFFYPKAALIFRYSNLFHFKLAIEGKQKSYAVEDMLNQPQLQITTVAPEEKIDYSASVNVSPVKWGSLRASVAYENYRSYRDYNYNEATAVYTPVSRTNVSMLVLNAVLEIASGDIFTLNTSYQYRLPFGSESLLYFSQNTMSLIADVKIKSLGIELNTDLNYKDSELLSPSLVLPGVILWNARVSKNISTDIFMDLKFKNILNMKNSLAVYVPGQGFGLSGGLRILL